MHPPEGPPVCTALNFLSPEMPPPMSKTSSRSDIPSGTSASPVFLTLPTRAMVLVPLLFSVPYSLNQSAPFCMIRPTQVRVSTLLMMVGLLQRPETAGNGGRGVGIPRSPSIDWIRAVSSPQTKAPAPSLILILKPNPEPRISSPNKPCSSACFIASRSRSSARGYSARQ